MDPFIGEIRIFGFNYAPQGWAYCNGQTMLIQQTQALFALIGIRFGGDGKTNFNLPNLQSRIPFGVDSRIPVNLAQSYGTETVTLSYNQLPSHTHNMVGEITPGAQALPAPSATAVPNFVLMPVGAKQVAQKVFSTTTTPNVTFAPNTIGPVGNGGSHENRQPFLTINFCICWDGIFPDFQD